MRKLKVYLDTSVISYLSQVTLDEIEKCSESKRNKLYDYLSDIEYTKLEINEEIVELAQKIIDMAFVSCCLV